MQRPLLLFIPLLLLCCGGLYYFRNAKAEELTPSPAAQATPAGTEEAEYQTVGGSRAVVTATPITPMAQPDAELTVKQLLQLRGAPKSRITNNDTEILNYEDMSYRVKNGVIVSRQTIDRPRERQSQQAPSRSDPASYTQQRQYREPVKQTRQYQPEPSTPGQNPERHRETVRYRAERWASTMRSYNTYDWWHFSNIADLSQFSPVTGWANRYSAQGVINMNTRNGTHAMNFEALLLLNDDGSFKDCEFTAK